MTNAGVSILMPVYNQQAYLPLAVESVLAQTWPNWELVIVDDASADASPEVARAYAARDPRVRYFRNPVNSGAATSYNVCVRRADPAFPYLIALPSDDRWSPTILEELLAVAEARPHVSLVHCDMQMMDAQGDFIGLYSGLFGDMPPPGEHRDFELLCRGNYFGHPATLARKRAVEQSPLASAPFDPRLVHIHDYYLWLVVMNAGAQAYYLPKPLAHWRKHEGQLTSDVNRLKIFLEELMVFRDLLPAHVTPGHERARAAAELERREMLGPLLLRAGRPGEAAQHLSAARALGGERRLDLTVAELIARLPVPQGTRQHLWNAAVRVHTTLRAGRGRGAARA